jgi:hypothetical protein
MTNFGIKIAGGGKALALTLALGVVAHASLDPAAKTAPRLAARAAADPVFTKETEHFAVFYSKTGVHAIAGATVDKDGNGHPDNVDDIAQELERIWRLAIDTMGYPQPVAAKRELGYGQDVPAGKFPVAIGDMATFVPSWGPDGMYGFCTAPGQDTSTPKGLEVVAENDFVNSSTSKAFQVKVNPINTPNLLDSVLYDYSKRPDLGWRVTLAHQFFHALQKKFDGTFILAFHEMSAIWFATRVYPDIHHEWQYLQKFVNIVNQPAFSTWEKEELAEFPMVTAMVKAYGDIIVRQLWENRNMIIENGSLTSETVWAHRVMIKMGYDESLFTKTFVEMVARLAFNLDKSEWPTYKTTNVTIVQALQDTAEKDNWTGYSVGGPFQVEIYRLNLAEITGKWNFKFSYVTTTSSAASGIIRLPSKEVTVVRPLGGPFVFNKNPGDTAIYAIMSAGYDGLKPGDHSSISLGVTAAPVSTGIQKRVKGLAPGAALRLDLQGRPVKEGSHGIVLEYQPNHGWVRRVKLGE